MKPITTITYNTDSSQQLEELSTLINNTRWYRQAAASKVIFLATPALGVCEFVKYPAIYCFSKEFEGYYSLRGLNKDAHDIVKKCKKDSSFVQVFYREFQRLCTVIRRAFQKAAKIDFQTAPLHIIVAINQELDKLNYKFWRVSFLGDVFDPEGDLILKEELKHPLTPMEISDLIRPQKKNFIENSNLELFQIAVKARKASPEQKLNLLTPFAAKYFFIQNSWENAVRLTAKDFLLPLQEILKQPEERLHEMIVYYQSLEIKTKEKAEQLHQKYAFSAEISRVIALYRILATIRDERKEIVLLFNHFLEETSKRYACEFGIQQSLTDRALVQELSAIKTKEDMLALKLKLEERKQVIIARSRAGSEVLIFGKVAQQLITQMHQKLTARTESLQGRVACRGGKSKIRGRVKIILGETHFTKFQEGDILIAPMTRPEYVPLMKKAKGIITDEGGITCHAAIAGRELNVPCIIGTSIATKKLFDNRTIEMDMETGRITLI